MHDLATTRSLVSQGVEREIASLRAPRVRARVMEIALFTSMWAAGGAVVMLGLGARSATAEWTLQAAGTLIIALALHMIALLVHDGVHRSLFRDPTVNRWASFVLGATVLMSASAYQAMHERHHNFLGDERDPDDYHNYSGDRRVLWAMHYLRLLAGTFLYIALIPVMVARLASPREKRRVLVEYTLLAAIYAALAFLVPWSVLLHAWLLPIIPAGIMFNIRSLAAHGLTDSRDPLLASRSIDAHPVVAFLFRNENFHLEHHLFPEIPSYNLAQVHRLVFPRMPRATIARSYLGFLAQFVRQSLALDETPIGVVHHDR